MPRPVEIISKKPSPARWPCPSKGGHILISRMTNDHLLNTIYYLIHQAGHKHKRFDTLVKEAAKRGLNLPEHRWIKSANGPKIKASIEEKDPIRGFRSPESGPEISGPESGVYNPAWRD